MSREGAEQQVVRQAEEIRQLKDQVEFLREEIAEYGKRWSSWCAITEGSRPEEKLLDQVTNYLGCSWDDLGAKVRALKMRSNEYESYQTQSKGTIAQLRDEACELRRASAAVREDAKSLEKENRALREKLEKDQGFANEAFDNRGDLLDHIKCTIGASSWLDIAGMVENIRHDRRQLRAAVTVLKNKLRASSSVLEVVLSSDYVDKAEGCMDLVVLVNDTECIRAPYSDQGVVSYAVKREIPIRG